jgi:HEAT repeat protein
MMLGMRIVREPSDDLIARAELLRARVDGHPEYCAEVVPELVVMLGVTNDPAVLIVIAQALHAAWNNEASLALLPFASHPDADVRLAVTRALPGGVDDPAAKDRVARALVQLTNDDSSQVRDWAVFGLGSILDVDTPEIREALRAHLFDSDLDTRLEALVGLAERRDPTILDLLRDELRGDTVERLVVDAARAFADSSLLPLLLELSHHWDQDPDLLRRAIETCRSGNQEA